MPVEVHEPLRDFDFFNCLDFKDHHGRAPIRDGEEACRAKSLRKYSRVLQPPNQGRKHRTMHMTCSHLYQCVNKYNRIQLCGLVNITAWFQSSVLTSRRS